MERDIRQSPLYKEVEEHFRQALEPGFGRLSGAAQLDVSPDGRLIAFTGTTLEKLEGAPTLRIWTADAESGRLRRITGGPHDDRMPRWSPDGLSLAFLTDRARRGRFQLAVLGRDHLGEAAETPVVAGTAEYLQWAPDGSGVLLGVAGSGAELAGVQGSGATEGEEQDLPSWMPLVEHGISPNEWRRLYRHDLATGKTVSASRDGLNVWEAAWAGPDCVLAVVSQSPTENAWYGALLALIDPATGQERIIYRPEWQIGVPAASPDGKRLSVVEAMCSDRNVIAGNLLLFDWDGAEPRRLDTDGVDVTFSRWTDNNRLLYAGVRGAEAVLAEFDASTGKGRELWRTEESCGPGYPVVAPVPDGSFTTELESFTRFPEIAVVRDGEARTLCSLEHEGAEYVRSQHGEIRQFVWQAPDGLEIGGWLATPCGTGPFPLIAHIHGGPVSVTRNRWIGPGLISLLLSRGYALFFPNPRGSTGRGQEFVRLEYGDVGGAETADTLSGIDALVEQGIADPKRLGVTGASHGGYMTCWLVTQTDRFGAAVSVAPVTDFFSQHYTSNIGEFDHLFLRDEPSNPSGPYSQRSPIFFAGRVRTPTLLVAGGVDRCTPSGQAREFYQALQQNGIESALAVYPQEGHGVRKMPAVIDFTTRTLDWFEKHL